MEPSVKFSEWYNIMLKLKAAVNNGYDKAAFDAAFIELEAFLATNKPGDFQLDEAHVIQSGVALADITRIAMQSGLV